MTRRLQQKKSCPIPCTFTTGRRTGCILSDYDASLMTALKQSDMLELIFHMKDTIMKAGGRRFYNIFCCGHQIKEGGNGPD